MGRVTTLRVAYRREPRDGLWEYVMSADAATALSSPLIYSLAIPMVLLDVWVSVYQAVCFRAWGIRRVRRRDYFIQDRHRLPYLNALQKANCAYCSYVNSVLAYVSEITARTEQYWCPIGHSRRVRGAHARARAFAAHGDATAYRSRLSTLRDRLRK